MRSVLKGAVIALSILFILVLALPAAGPYQLTWNSLRNVHTPQWLKDGKFGIYTHWGVYAVPAVGKNGTWYINSVYTKPDSPQRFKSINNLVDNVVDRVSKNGFCY